MFYQLAAEQPVRIRPKATVTLERRLDGSLHMKCKCVELAFKQLPKRPYRPYYKRRKPLQEKPALPVYKPSKKHPWRVWRPKTTAQDDAAPQQEQLLIT